MHSKLQFLMDGNLDGDVLPNQFKWHEREDGTWDYDNGKYKGRGNFITALYSGCHGQSTPSDLGLHLGDVVGITQGRCWRVKATRAPSIFDCYGIAMGWYEDSDGVIVQITGNVYGIGGKWSPGSRVYLPFYGYGKPDQSEKPRADKFPIGLALNEQDLHLLQFLDS